MDDTTAARPPALATFRPSTGACRWEGVEEHAYKEEGSAPFGRPTEDLEPPCVCFCQSMKG